MTLINSYVRVRVAIDVVEGRTPSFGWLGSTCAAEYATPFGCPGSMHTYVLCSLVIIIYTSVGSGSISSVRDEGLCSTSGLASRNFPN